MAKDVKFNIKLTVDGKEQIVTASANVKQFAEELEIARTESTKLRDDLLKITQVGASFQHVVAGMQQLTGLMGTYTAASSAQVEAETKLATNMRNTMGARDEEIQSIKDLCAAQQQLGVIGDEVQLAGAQELATYLEKKSSLERLIPVMNDMVAQQYGLNATQESAATIATMLGKVMDGQVGALSRYGYTFDEAQEQILKFGTEEERAAVLADVVESAVGGMNESLARTDAGRAKQAANAIGDLKEQVGALFARIEPTVIAAGELGTAVMSIGTTYNGIRGVVTGFSGLAQRALAGVRATYALSASLAAEAGMSGVAATATAVLTTAVTGLMAASGVGLVIAGVTWALQQLTGASRAAVGGLGELSGASDRHRQAEEALTGTYGRAVSEMEAEKKKLKELIDGKGDASGAIARLNEKYGESFGYYRTAGEWYDALIAKSEDYCMQLAYEAQAKALYQQRAENQIRLQQNFSARRQLWESGGAQERVVSSGFTGTAGVTVGAGTSVRETQALKDLRKAGAALIKEQAGINEQLRIAQAERDKHLRALGGGIATGAQQTGRPGGGAATGSQRTGLGGGGGGLSGEVAYAAGSLGDIEQRMRRLRDERLHLVDPEELLRVDEELVALEQAKLRMEVEPRLLGWERRKEELGRDGIEFDKGGGFEPVTLAVAVDAELVRRGLKDAAGQLNKGKLQLPAEVLPQAGGAVDVKAPDFEGFKAAAGALDQLAESMRRLSGESKGMAAAMAGVSLAASLSQLVAGMVQKANGTSLTIWDWVAGVAAGTAAVVSTASELKGIGVFAQGGLAYGPTLGLFGEYAGARTNPEVVAPLDRLRGLLGGGPGGGGVVFRIAGRELVGVLRNETQIGALSGRRTGLG